MLKALLFDVDGTLADTERDGHRVAFNRAFAEAGLDWRWDVELYGQLLEVTGGKERMRYYLERFRPDYRRPPDLDALIARLHAQKTKHYTALLAQGEIPLRHGVERLLREARGAGLRLGIATTTTPENVYALLENTLGKDSIGWFDVIAAGDIVPKKKPAPDIYLYALAQMHLLPQDCLAFEDSANGVQSARGAGIHCVVTINDYTRNHDFADAALVLNHLGTAAEPCSTLRSVDIAAVGAIDVAYLRRLHARCAARTSRAPR